jgi:hypothetical protein
MEKMIIGGAIGIIIALILNMIQWIWVVTSPFKSLSKATLPYVRASIIILTQSR